MMIDIRTNDVVDADGRSFWVEEGANMSYYLKSLALILILTLLTSCVPASAALSPIPKATQQPTALPAPDIIRPPAASLEIGGHIQVAGIGSYCWQSGGAISNGLCADMAGIPTAHDPLVLTEFPLNAKFHFEMKLAPDNVTMSVMPVTSEQELVGADSTHRFWNPGEGWSGSLPPKVSFEYLFQETEFVNGNGLYLILISASWKDRGDASYGFLIQIGAGNQQVDVTPGASFPTPELVPLQSMTPVTRLGKGAASSLALSAGGQRLAVNTPLGVYVYETKTQNVLWFLPLSNHWRVLDFSPDGESLAIGAQNGGVLVVRADTGETLYQITTEESGQPDWSPDGTKLLTGAGCEEVKVWDGKTGAFLHLVQDVKCNNVVPGIVRAVWSGDGRQIYVTPSNGYVLAYDAETSQPLTGYTPHPPEFSFDSNIVPSPTQNLLALVDGLNIAVMDGKTGEIVKVLEGNYQDRRFEELAWSPDSNFLAAGNYGQITIWDVNTSQQTYNISGYWTLPGLSWMPDGKTLIGLLSTDGSLNAIDPASGRKFLSLDGFGSICAFSTYPRWDGSELLTYDGANIVRWDPATGKAVRRSVAPPPPYWAPKYGGDQALSPDGSRIALGQVVVEANTGHELASLKQVASRGRDRVAWSPDGRFVVSGDSLGMAETVVWDSRTGQVLLRLENSQSYLGALSWSADGKQIAGGSDGFIAIWDSLTGRQIHRLTADMTSERIQSLAWSPDNQSLVAGTASGKIYLWDMQKNIPIAILNGHADQVLGLSWSSDSTLLASNSMDGTVLVWKLP